MTKDDTNDLTYAEAREAAQPRIAELRAYLNAELDQAQAFWRDVLRAMREAFQPLARFLTRVWTQIVRCIQREGPLSPALAYATPAMRRRAVRQRAHLAMQAKQQRLR